MAVRKSINIAGSGPTIEASIHEAIDRRLHHARGDHSLRGHQDQR